MGHRLLPQVHDLEGCNNNKQKEDTNESLACSNNHLSTKSRSGLAIIIHRDEILDWYRTITIQVRFVPHQPN